MTEVELLRRAAKQMRERAEAANTDDARRPYGDRSVDPVRVNEWGALVDNYLGGEIGEHCASWHPVVALAVADWLDAEARLHGTVGKAQDKVPDGWALRITSSTLREAVAVARAYLGESS